MVACYETLFGNGLHVCLVLKSNWLCILLGLNYSPSGLALKGSDIPDAVLGSLALEEESSQAGEAGSLAGASSVFQCHTGFGLLVSSTEEISRRPFHRGRAPFHSKDSQPVFF